MKIRIRSAVALTLAVAALGTPSLAVASTPASAAQPSSRGPEAASAESTDLAFATPVATPLALSDQEKAQQDASGGYNSEYIFALTRGLASSSMHPAGKVPLFIFTLPLDVVFLPFAAIAGLFG